MSDFLYVVFTKIAPQYEHEHNVWQETEHRPYLLGLPGYRYVAGYKDCGNEYRYANFWHISRPADFDNPERKIRANTPWGVFLSPFRERRIDFYVQDGGLEMEPPMAELDARCGVMLMDAYSEEDDVSFRITKRFRKIVLPDIREDLNVLDARLYHAYNGKAAAQHCVFYYLCTTESDGDKVVTQVVRHIDSLLGEERQHIARSCFRCVGKLSAQASKSE